MNIRRLILYLMFIIFSSCRQETYKITLPSLQKQITFTSSSKDFVLEDKNNKLIFKNGKYKTINTGKLFYFIADKEIRLKTLLVNTPEKQSFKLYINGISLGKFTKGQHINVRKKVKSLKILFLKDKNERLIKGWKDSTIIILGNKSETASHPEIIFTIAEKDKNTRFHIRNLRKSRQNKALNKKFIERYFKKGVLLSNGMFYTKTGNTKTQFGLRFFDDNSFTLYQLISFKKSKKIKQELFFTGIWQCNKISKNKAQLILKGKLSGYFPEHTTEIIKNKDLVLNVNLVNKQIYFSKLFVPVYIDFPDDAMINIKGFIPSAQVKLAYATAQNFTKTVLYPCNKCFIRYKVAKALLNVQNELQKKGMSLKFFDCYRPYHVQELMFEKFPVKGYVASPVGGSIHNRGLAVDLTITDSSGRTVAEKSWKWAPDTTVFP